ncbi:hypothetical protein ACIBCT_14620 [Streptosporangium sp. NPDC050855]|uniref:hypothetical protein n=1 Tax=Streptosporangium sp. NPDC050855 TaxID=3366194 RepID=UPI003788FF92
MRDRGALLALPLPLPLTPVAVVVVPAAVAAGPYLWHRSRPAPLSPPSTGAER